MLRALVAVLLVANLAFWAWSSGLLEDLGLGPVRERDPTRVAQQLYPEAVRVLPPGAAVPASNEPGNAGTAASAAAGGPLLCLEAGPFAAGAVEAAERALAAVGLAEGSWVRLSQDTAAQYAVVLGPYGNREGLQKKREELGRLNLSFEALDLPSEGAGAAPQPGFALARFDSRAAADTALAGFNQRGVRTARVAMLRPAGSESRLRVEGASAAQAEQLRGLSGLGAGFAACAAPALPGPAPTTTLR